MSAERTVATAQEERCPTCGHPAVIIGNTPTAALARIEDRLGPPVLMKLDARMAEVIASGGSAHIELHIHIRDGKLQYTEPKWDEKFRPTRTK